jgi:hypothetical protein
VDLAYQQHFGKQQMILNEQINRNIKLESLVQSSSDKLTYEKGQ